MARCGAAESQYFFQGGECSKESELTPGQQGQDDVKGEVEEEQREGAARGSGVGSVLQ